MTVLADNATKNYINSTFQVKLGAETRTFGLG